jgi:hypothetical protein
MGWSLIQRSPTVCIKVYVIKKTLQVEENLSSEESPLKKFKSINYFTYN